MRRAFQIRGSVLVIVLVTLLFTSFALVLFMEQAGTDLIVVARDHVSARLRRDAYSALDASLAAIEEFRRADGALHHPSEGWSDPLGFSGWQPRAGCEVQVSVQDESGKISLSHVDAAMLTNLFKAWEVKTADAERLTDALLGWMRRDYVPSSARSPEYDQGELPFEAPARPLRSFSELASIDFVREQFYDEHGRPNDLWRRFVSVFSLYNYQQLNLNAASPDVFAAVGFSDPSQYNRLKDFLTGSGGYSNVGAAWLTSTAQAAGILGSTDLPRSIGVQVRALRITVVVRESANEFHLSAVVAPNGGATVVKTTASPAAAAVTGPAAKPAAATSVAPVPPAPALNYPFTLLEIRENGEIPTPLSAAPPA